MAKIKIERSGDGVELEKTLASNKRELLSDNLRGTFKFNDCCYSTYLMDYDDEYVYFEVWVEAVSKYVNFRVSYEATETTASFGDDVVEVIRKVEYVPVEAPEPDEDTLTKKITKAITDYFGGSKQATEGLVMKQFDEAKMIAIEPLYCPPDVVDLHGDSMDAETIEGMVADINKKIEDEELESRYFHKEVTEDFYFKKVWVNPVDCHIGEHFVPEGQPLAEVQFISKEAWEARLEGGLMGLSIGGHAAEIEEV